MLDELPYGNFVELEGETEEMIEVLARKLNLNWDATIERSYSALFADVQKNLNLSFRDLSFDNFAGMKVDTTDLESRRRISSLGQGFCKVEPSYVISLSNREERKAHEEQSFFLAHLASFAVQILVCQTLTSPVLGGNTIENRIKTTYTVVAWFTAPHK